MFMHGCMHEVRVIQGEKKELGGGHIAISYIIYERQKMFNPVPRPRTWPGDEDPNVVGTFIQ